MHLAPDTTVPASHHSIFYRLDALTASSIKALKAAYSDHQSSFICFLPSIAIHGILPVQFTLQNLCPSSLCSISWSCNLHFILHNLFAQSLSSFCSTCPYHHILFCCSTEIISSNSSLSLNFLLGTLSFTLTPHIRLPFLSMPAEVPPHYARQHICYSAYMPWQFRLSVCLSICLSDGWISQKRLKIRSRNFHHTVAPSLYFFRGKFHPEFLRGSPWARASNKGGVGKISHFLPLSVNISKTVQDTTKVTIDH